MAAETIVITSPTAQAYAELQAAFDHYNRELFGGELPPCLITMQREKRTYGYFSSERFVHRHDRSKTDEIAINPSYFAVVPLLEVLRGAGPGSSAAPGRRCRLRSRAARTGAARGPPWLVKMFRQPLAGP